MAEPFPAVGSTRKNPKTPLFCIVYVFFTPLLFCATLFVVFAPSRSIADDESPSDTSKFNGAISGEAWYAFWNGGGINENQAGVLPKSYQYKVEYGIDPTLLNGVGGTATIGPSGSPKAHFVVKLFINQILALYGKELSIANDNGEIYRLIFGEFCRALKNDANMDLFLSAKIINGYYKGNLTVVDAGENFSLPQGTLRNISTDFWMADMIVFVAGDRPRSFSLGLGSKLINYSIPSPHLIAHRYSKKYMENHPERSDRHRIFLSTVTDATFRTASGLLMVASKDYFMQSALQPNFGFYYYVSVFVGSGVAENRYHRWYGMDVFSFGWDLQAGFERPFVFLNKSVLIPRAGYRYLSHNLYATNQNTDEDSSDNYQATGAEDEWHGPSVSITLKF